MQISKPLRYATGAIIVAMLVGCGEQQSVVTDQSGMQGAVEALAEYRQESARLRLPPGVSWESDPLPDKSGRYQIGLATTAADEYWLCKWEVEWLDRRAKADDGSVALTQLTLFPSLHMYDRLDDESRDFHRRELVQAAGGDASLVEQHVEANGCRLR